MLFIYMHDSSPSPCCDSQRRKSLRSSCISNQLHCAQNQLPNAVYFNAATDIHPPCCTCNGSAHAAHNRTFQQDNVFLQHIRSTRRLFAFFSFSQESVAKCLCCSQTQTWQICTTIIWTATACSRQPLPVLKRRAPPLLLDTLRF